MVAGAAEGARHPLGPRRPHESDPGCGRATLPERPRILLLKLDHIGDMVLAMRAMLLVRKAWPDAHITLVCGPWNVALARQLGLFDSIIAYRFFSEAAPDAQAAVSDRHAAFAALDLGEPFDLAIDMRYDQDTRPLLEAIDARFRAGYSARNLKTALNLELPTTEQASRRDRPLLPIDAETRLMMLASAVVGCLADRRCTPSMAWRQRS